MATSPFSLGSMLKHIQRLATPGKGNGSVVTLRVTGLTDSTVEHCFRIVEMAHDPKGAALRILSADEVLIDLDQGLRVNEATIGHIVTVRKILYAHLGTDIGVEVVAPN